MPTDQLQISEGLIFDGAVSAATALVLGIALMAATAWLLWRDRHTVGPIWACLFFCLRLAAVGLALWMLAGPMHETIERSTTTQSIAILADASQSMETVDSVDPRTALRWRLATATDGDQSPLARCDRARIAAGIANTACQSAQRKLSEHRPLREVKHAIDELAVAIHRVEKHCAQMASQLSGQRDDLVQRIGRIETLVEGPVGQALESLENSLDSRGNVTGDELTTSLANLGEDVLGISRRIDSLARDLAQQLAPPTDGVEMTRREQAVRTLDTLEQSVLTKLAEQVRIRRFQFDERLTPVASGQSWSDASALRMASYDSTIEDPKAQPRPPLTNLATVLERLSKDRAAESTRLAVVLSDGHHNDLDARAPQDVATQMTDLPVFVVPVGSSQSVRDIRLHRVEAPKKVVENDTTLIEAIVTAFDCDAMSSEVVLRHDGQEIDRQRVDFTGERIDQRIEFRVSADEVGWQEYELAVEPLDEESSVANNVALVSWEVVRDKFRVLLADGVSRWEYRYLQQLFRRDRHVDFDELLFYPRLRGTGQLAANPRLPDQVDDWAVYDVVIFGDIGRRQFSSASQAALVEYVRERHGNLIVVAGRDHMPHEYEGKPFLELLPVEGDPSLIQVEAHSLVLTDEGRLHSALAITDSARESEQTWLDVYQRHPVHRMSNYSRPKPTARTLLRAVPAVDALLVDDKSDYEDQPAFLCWHQVGAGRVVYLAAPEIWRLRFRRGDRLLHRFWGQMLRWMTATNLGSGSELVRLSTDRTRYDKNQSIEITVWLKDQTGRPLDGQDVTASARSLDQTVATIPLESDDEVEGRYFGVMTGLTPGAYEIVVGGAAVDELLPSTDERIAHSLITIDESDNVEMLDTRTNRALLEQIAHITGGQVIPPTAIGEVLQLASLSPEVNETVRRTPLWNRWTNLWIVLGCLFFEWIVRKQKGLV